MVAIQNRAMSPGSTDRQIELKLIKAYPTSWPAVIHDGTAAAAPPVPGPSTQRFDSAPPPTALQAKKERRNWDKFVDDELNGEQEEVKDPVRLAFRLFNPLSIACIFAVSRS